MRKKFLPYGHQWIDQDDIDSVINVLKSDWITQGSKIDEFEKKLADYCGAKYAVAVSSGTAALHAACLAAGIGENDEVIVPPITFAATSNAVVYCGARPVFADVDENTINIDPMEIVKKISSRTKAIIPVDFAGHPAHLDEINEIAQRNGLCVIEDAAHALGAEYRGSRIGSLSDMTIFSFHPVKHITTGEGGMVLTNNSDYYDKLRIIRHHGIEKNSSDDPWYYQIRELGYNYRITDFQCALGISQLKKLDFFIERRREIANMYNKVFSEFDELITPNNGQFVKAVHHIYVIQLRLDKIKVTREKIFNALREENIGVNVHYVPVHLQPFYMDKFGYGIGDFPNAELYYDRAITLPLFPKMSDGDVYDVIEAVEKVIDRFRN